MARLTWFFAVVSSAVVVSVTSRGAADPEGATEPGAPESRQPLTWHATPPGTTERADDPERQQPAPHDDASRAMDDGRTLPFTVGAAMPKAHADVTALGGYDSAAGQARARSTAEAKVLPFLALRLEYDHGPNTGSNDSLTLGARVQILNQAKHGLDLGAGFFYAARDFRGEGDFVGSIMLGRNFGRFGVFCNTLVGVDSEGDDQSTELRLSSTYRATKLLHVGLDARGRYNFSSDDKRYSSQQLNWEVQAGPLASLALGPVGLQAIVGPSALHLTPPGATSGGRTELGAVAMGGAAAVF
jgi:hypothetical protein